MDMMETNYEKKRIEARYQSKQSSHVRIGTEGGVYVNRQKSGSHNG